MACALYATLGFEKIRLKPLFEAHASHFILTLINALKAVHEAGYKLTDPGGADVLVKHFAGVFPGSIEPKEAPPPDSSKPK
jgi:hypothetical protein